MTTMQLAPVNPANPNGHFILALALLALLGLAVAVTSGKLGGPSDLEMRVRASEPVNLEP
jgi:hypothetical protein